MVLPPSMQGSLPAGWLAFTGRESNPLDHSERFQITFSSPLPGLILTQRSPLSIIPIGIFVPTFPQRSPPWFLTKAACGGLRSTPDCRPRRAILHLLYSYASPCGPALLVTQDPHRSSTRPAFAERNLWNVGARVDRLFHF